ncbi:PREDICTED: dirigent protein 17 [Nelumbo nucifera]|uniref:Dirigent protein n=2 Tax=Nelumbo nucifera TaxID=4432 RepID=A0A822Z6C1_NELNU|nr:PREDICTED: dirigent protein 17 [Nelumbo nucifera]DAD40602.1 TPA_asm: hypothetical protein HUJ06_014925 [Nelumbo nucifera]
MVLPKVIFCTAVSVATLAVILLAVVSPVSHRKAQKQQASPWLALSLYIQQPHTTVPSKQPASPSHRGAFLFHHTLTEGPENTSRVIGKAQGFIIPVEDFAHSVFNIIYLTFDTPEYYGSLGVQAKNVGYKDREEFMVVGGTGSFAFARGLAVFAHTDRQPSDVGAMYHLKLRLKLPNPTERIPR